MSTDYVSLDELKEKYPDEWVLLGNPDMKDTSVLGGIVLFHSKDKKEVYHNGRDKTAEFDTVTITFAGDLRQHRKVGILKRI